MSTERYVRGFVSGEWRDYDGSGNARKVAPLPAIIDRARSWSGGVVPLLDRDHVLMLCAEQIAIGGDAPGLTETDALTFDGETLTFRPACDPDHVSEITAETVLGEIVWPIETGWTWYETSVPAALVITVDGEIDEDHTYDLPRTGESEDWAETEQMALEMLYTLSGEYPGNEIALRVLHPVLPETFAREIPSVPDRYAVTHRGAIVETFTDRLSALAGLDRLSDLHGEDAISLHRI